MTNVEAHRDLVRRALVALDLGDNDLTQLLMHPEADSAVRLSGLLVLLADTADDPVDDAPTIVVIGQEDPTVDWLGRERGPWAYLSSVRLPWTPETATIAVRLVTGCPAYDDRRVAIALRGAGRVCASGRADVPLLDALSTVRAYLAELGDEQYQIKEMRGLATRVTASASHPDLLDLSTLLDGDTWAPAATAAAEQAEGADIAPLVRLLVELGPRKPPKKWLHETRVALESPAARQLVRDWLEVAEVADVVPEWPDSSLEYCRGVLFIETNNDIVRATVWATSVLPSDASWPPRTLGVLARRGAAVNGLPGFPEALALKVASASVEALISRDGPADRAVLAELLEDLSRRDLLKKIGAHLGREAEVASRSEQLVRQRAVEQRAKASPAVRKARAARDSMLREHLGPTLRGLGFKGGPVTWTRHHEDRLDRITVNANVDRDGLNSLGLSYGTHFLAMDELERATEGAVPSEYDDRRRSWATNPAHLHLDVLDGALDEEWEEESDSHVDAFSAESLADVATHIGTVLVPLLDSLHDYDVALAVLESGAGLPEDAYRHEDPDSFARHKLVGAFALAHGDRTTARRHLARAVALAEGFTSTGGPYDSTSDILAHVQFLHDRAERLPGDPST